MPPFEKILADSYTRFLREGDNAIDIGVHHGLHFARIRECIGASGSIVGFEPVPDFVQVAREALGSDADLRSMALSDKPGTGEFLYMTQAVGESGFKERASTANRGARKIEIAISTLDREFAGLERLAFIKIDIEGHELSALAGGRALLARTRPILSVEYGVPTYSLYGHTNDSLMDWAEGSGYLISDLFGNIVRDREEWHFVCDRGYWDYFLVPQESRARWHSIFPAEPLPFD